LVNDKIIHLVGSLLFTLLSPQPAEQARDTCIIIGATKEVVYDKMMGRGEMDIRDFAADYIGAQIGYHMRGDKHKKKKPKMEIVGLDGKVI
jgi:hypothetical protein